MVAWWKVYGRLKEGLWSLEGRFMVAWRKVHGRLKVGLWSLEGRFMVAWRKVYGRLKEGLWSLEGRFMVAWRKVYGRLKEGLWSLEEMLQQLKIELEAKERSRTLEPKLYPPYEKYSTPSSLTVSSNTDNRRRGYCSGLHPPAKCQQISERNARKNCFRKKGNCFIWLKHGHTSISCPSNYRCF